MGENRTALIFAAGLGTRLKPLTDTLPKALVPYQGKPLLESVIKNLKQHNFNRFVINIHHFGDKIIDFTAENNNFGADIYFSDERDLLRDTGGGIKHASSYLKESQHFLVHNVDIISNLNLDKFYSEYSTKQDMLATLVVSQRKTSRYFLFNEDSRLVGWTNISTGEVRSPYLEIQQLSSTEACKLYKPLAFAGIHLISNKIFSLLEDRSEEVFSIVDFYLKAAKNHVIYGWEAPADVNIRDIGKLHELGSTTITKA